MTTTDRQHILKMLITKQNNSQQGVQKRTIVRSIRIGPISLRFISLLLLASLGMIYIATSSQAATKSYSVYMLNNNLEALQKENDWLNAEAARLKSVKQSDSIIQELNLEPTQSSDVSYDPGRSN